MSSALRRLAVPPARLALRGAVGLRTATWPERSHLFALHDGRTWSVAEDAADLEATAGRLGIPTGPASLAKYCGGQAVFHTSHFEAVEPRWLASTHRLGVAWLHGRPGTVTNPEFDRAWSVLRGHPDRFDAIQVTHPEMHELVVDAGVAPERVHRIPIGIDLPHFTVPDAATRAAKRRELDLPETAFVVGSFQKDGEGWDEGNEPKLIKGPDVLVASLVRAAPEIPELHVLLTGPARGYVRHALTAAGIPHTHITPPTRTALAGAFHGLDAYVVSSRQEGGPKGVLESLASGVPLVSTRVGQAPEIVEDGVHGLLVDVEDADAIAAGLARVHADGSLAPRLAHAGRIRAEQFDFPRLDPLWGTLLGGLVTHRG